MNQPQINRWRGKVRLLETCLEEQERAHGEEGRADDGHDPVHAAAARPAEPEHRDWEEDGANHGDGQTGFWNEVYSEKVS